MSLTQTSSLRDGVPRRATPFASRLSRFEPATLLWLAAVIALGALVVVPLVRLLISSFQSTDTGAFTLDNYAIAWGHPREVIALGNSLLYALEVTLLSTVLAVPIAWSVSRTTMPAKGLVRALIIGAFITPPYLGAIGWILLAGPNAGWLNRVWMALTGSDSGFANIYSFGGMVWVTALYAFPYIFVFTSAALDLVSSEMEEAANILGAGGVRTILRITLPLVLPAILGGAIIVFLDTVALFGTPAIIALPARIPTMTLVLWQFFEFPVRAEAAAAYAIPLIVITLAMVAMQRLLLGRKGYVALTGKGGGRRPTQLGAWRWLALGYALFVVGMAVILPYAALAQAAFSKAWGLGFSWANLTLANFGAVLFQAELARHDHPQLHLFRGRGIPDRRAGAGDRVHRHPPHRAGRQRAFPAVHGAAGHPRHCAGRRVLRYLRTATGRAVRHRRDPGVGLHHTLLADRLCQQPGRHALLESRNGGGGPHPGRRPAARAGEGRRAAAEDQPGRLLAAGVHPGNT